MNIWLVAVPCLWMAWRGYRAGAVTTLLRVFILLGGYALAWVAAPLLAPVIGGWHVLPMEILVLPAAGLVAFITASMVLNLLGTVIRRRWMDANEPAARPLGALFGGMAGVALGLLLVWFVSVMGDLLHSRQSASTANVTSPVLPANDGKVLQSADSQLRNLSADMVSGVASSVMGHSAAAPMVRETLREPLTVAEGLRRLTAKPAIQSLFGQPDNLAVLAGGNTGQIVRLSAFRELVADAELMQFLVSVGLPGDTDEARAAALAGNFALCARNVERLRNSDEFRAIISDPELQAQMQRQDLIALLGNAKVRRLVDMLAKSDAVEAAAPADPERLKGLPKANDPADRKVAERLGELVRQSETPQEKRRIYKWRDASGRPHFSYDKPPAGVQADVVEP